LLRQYGVEKLEAAGEKEATSQRHCAYYMGFLNRQHNPLQGNGQSQTIAAIQKDLENIHTAWRWALEREEITAVAGAITPFARYLHMAGRYQEGEAAFSAAAVSARRASTDPVLKVSVLARQGMFVLLMGNYTEGEALLQQCISLTAQVSEPHPDMPLIHHYLGVAAFYQGNYELAQQWYETAIDAAKRLGAIQGVARSLNTLGNVFHALGRYEEARDRYEQSLQIRQELNDQQGVAHCLNGLGLVAEYLGNYEQAAAFYKQSLEICRAVGDRPGVARGLHNLGAIRASVGALIEAQKLFRESLQIRYDIGDPGGIGLSLLNLGELSYHLKDYGEAQQTLENSLRYFQDTKQPARQALTTLTLGHVARQRGRLSEAERLYEDSHAIFTELGDQRSVAATLVGLGQIAAADGEQAVAEHYFRQALARGKSINAIPIVLDSLSGMAGCMLTRAQVEPAVRLLCLVQTHPASTQENKEVAEKLLAGLVQTLPETALEAARSQEYSLPEIIEQLTGEDNWMLR
jgi:tetratricopeptide (TPR) repeat protein